ncbi:MAG: hypothetical protein ACHQYP_09515 [Nitrospiria bacterium]
MEENEIKKLIVMWAILLELGISSEHPFSENYITESYSQQHDRSTHTDTIEKPFSDELRSTLAGDNQVNIPTVNMPFNNNGGDMVSENIKRKNFAYYYP